MIPEHRTGIQRFYERYPDYKIRNDRGEAEEMGIGTIVDYKHIEKSVSNRLTE